jgi:hypothetical protein
MLPYLFAPPVFPLPAYPPPPHTLLSHPPAPGPTWGGTGSNVSTNSTTAQAHAAQYKAYSRRMCYFCYAQVAMRPSYIGLAYYMAPTTTHGAPVRRGVVPSGLSAVGACPGVLGRWAMIEMLTDEPY